MLEAMRGGGRAASVTGAEMHMICDGMEDVGGNRRGQWCAAARRGVDAQAVAVTAGVGSGCAARPQGAVQ